MYLIRNFILCFLIILTLGCLKGHGTDLKNYVCKNRILLIIDNSENQFTYDKQLVNLGDFNKEFTERKLLIFRVNRTRLEILNSENSKTFENHDLWDRYNQRGDSFRLILIGLDGGVKLNQRTIINRKTLFSIIDSMPMRRSELRNNRTN